MSDPNASRIVAVVSDIHFDLHHESTWRAFRLWHAHVRPWKTVILGDFVDFGMLSKYVQEASAPIHALPQIRCFVKEANQLVQECGELVVVEGNHDHRWSKAIAALSAAAFKGAIGLSLREQCRFQGLDERVRWVIEDAHVSGVEIAQFILRHGHNQSGRFGGGKHLAANAIMKTLGQSTVMGHHHRAQMFCQTAFGKTSVAIANPCMTKEHEYAPGADWQRGFTVLELQAPRYEHATAYPVLIEKGKFAWGGRTYHGAPERDKGRKR